MSSENAAPSARKLPIVKLTIGLVVLAVIGGLLLRQVGLARLVEWLDQFIALIRDLGPWVFFTGMALLPAVGAPLSAFNLVAGEAFAPQMTMTGVILTVGVAIAANIAITYWLARYALRPLLTRLVARYGYAVPRVNKDNALSIALVVRLTPGPPFFLQSYVLGLAEVPFRLYLFVSWLAVMPLALSFVLLGKAAREGHFGKIGAVLGLIVVAVVVVQIVRRRVMKREA
ncbi:MAG: TVP38/TMEM64 family protein [Opitutaceae bacterium]|nr:TVP38/TMEM64 family protein [Opitutaceae bacterium]